MPGRKFSAGNGYRYGFNGKENDNEVKGEGNQLDFGDRIYDPRTGRWLSVDPLQAKYPGLSPYNYVANSPIIFIDPDGKKIKLSGTANDQEKFVSDLKLLTGLDLQLKNGEILLKTSGNPGPAFSSTLSDVVTSLLNEKGKHYENNVVFNLVNKKNGFESKFLEDESVTSKDVFLDQFLTGAYDMKDAANLKKTDMTVYATMLTHVLSERANIKDGNYEEFIKSIDKNPNDLTPEEREKISTYFNNAHLHGIIDETKVLEEFYTDKQGRTIRIPLREEKEVSFADLLRSMLEGKKSTKTEFDYRVIKINIFNDPRKNREITGAEIKVENPDLKKKVP